MAPQTPIDEVVSAGWILPVRVRPGGTGAPAVLDTGPVSQDPAPPVALDGASPDLRKTLSRLWPAEEGVLVTAGPVPAGYDLVEEYLALPSPGRARYLVPAAPRRAAAAALLRYNALRLPRVRAGRAVLGTVLRVGRPPGAGTVRVAVHRGLPADRRAESLLVRHLEGALGVPVLVGTGVRPDHPNLKPTLQLLDRRGDPVGFAKLGAGPGTDRLVLHEAAVLAGLPAHVRSALGAPALLHSGRWRGRPLLVTSPLPSDLRRHPDFDEVPPYGLTATLAGVQATTARLAASDYWAGTARRIGAVTDPAEADLRQALLAHHDAIRARWGDRPIELGWWHGDWAPWNVGWSGSRIAVWDWEYAAAGVPKGMDLAHWHFQVGFVMRKEEPDVAMAAVDRLLPGTAADLGVDRETARCLAELYLVEAALRHHELAAAGGGWTESFRPGVLRALTRRAARLSAR